MTTSPSSGPPEGRELNELMDRFARMIAESPAPDSETVSLKVGDIRGMALALLERNADAARYSYMRSRGWVNDEKIDEDRTIHNQARLS